MHCALLELNAPLRVRRVDASLGGESLADYICEGWMPELRVYKRETRHLCGSQDEKIIAFMPVWTYVIERGGLWNVHHR